MVSDQIKIVTVVGARPQFIKAAMVSRAIVKHHERLKTPNIIEEIVHTGQHFDEAMSEIFFKDMGIPEPVVNLNVNSAGHGEMTGRMLIDLEKQFIDRKPDCVLVYGDTNSTLAGALAAAKLHIPVAHVEAGLRSFNKTMPEEINRILTDHVSTFLFCPTRASVDNLKNEGISKNHYGKNDSQTPVVARIGDVMYDAAIVFGDIAERESTILQDLGLCPREYMLATVHRAENVDHPDRLLNILNAFGKVNFPVLFPVHPRTKNKIADLGINKTLPEVENLQFIDPVSFLDMVKLEKHAKTILTDSGGGQKEAYFHGVPCVTLRDETEWVETVEAGWNTLAGANVEKIVAATRAAKPGVEIDQYGDGHSSERIVEFLVSNLHS
ncbi:UDP-2,3-diacetamido-2,3-dideoxy-D-glucuronic acid 2-epimerase (EC [Olavius algarvensis associated proteobacterium Delta 3]|nr:UDP-2,3-diacetamido-2,3-dideoxy-D-glucuronic acid 2-epimerase (EC [Olavius algarvensis associated proteobacterium Delta 3]